MRLILCFVTYSIAQFSCTNDLRSRKQEEIEEVAKSIVDVARQLESSCDATIRTCLVTKKSHGPRNQVLFSICHFVASLKFTLKRGYQQTIHFMYGPIGNSQFRFPESPDETSGLVGKNKLTSFPRNGNHECPYSPTFESHQ